MLQQRSRTNIDLTEAAAEAEARYVAANPLSAERYAQATEAMPGGNTRTVLHFSPFPLTLASGAGCRLRDIDGHDYADFLGEYSAGLYGHSNPVIQQAIRQAVEDGTVLGGPNCYEAALAAELCRRFPSVERVRFCNSGTEANLFALQAARLATGREAIMVFHGAYHGGVFYFGQHKSEINAPFPWIYGHYNDIERTLGLIEQHADELAAVVLEPMMGSAGGIAATTEFLQALRAACTKHGIVLVFDEVMTSRTTAGGLQQLRGVTPDMTTFGKYLGGGASFGAFGGRAELMARFDPRRPDAVSHAGTFNNNVISMAAGLAGLTQLYTPAAAERLTADGEALRGRLNALATRHGMPVQLLGVGSIMCVHFHGGEIRRPEDAWPRDEAHAARNADLQKLLHLDMLAAGQYMARRGFITLSLPIKAADFDGFCAAFEEFLSVRGPVVAAVVD
ncbi:MAG: aspartate aminotransferase family protein [Dongiaceae bacterium]